MTTFEQHDKPAVGLNADSWVLTLNEPRLLDTLPVLEDEGGIFTLPLTAQREPLRLAVDAWDSYQTDYREMTEGGQLNLRVVLQAFRDGQPVGDPISRAMTPDPADLFPIEWQVDAPSPLRDREYDIQYQYWYDEVFNKATSFPTKVYYDRTAPNENSPFTFTGPTLIDRAYLHANNGFAQFEIPRWADIRLEDRVHVFFQPMEGAPGTPIKSFDITSVNRGQDPIVLRIEEALLTAGVFNVACQLHDRAGNINQGSSVLRVTVDLSGVELPSLLKPERLDPNFVTFFGWINCATLDYATRDPWPDELIPKGVRFRVPLPQDGVAPGDLVQMGWQMCQDLVGGKPISEQPVWLDPVPLRADGYLVMDRLHELIVQEFEKVFTPGVDPFDGSVRVSYRIQTSGGRWRTSKVDVVGVSLQGPSMENLCTGPWMKRQEQVQQGRRLIMGAEEKGVGLDAGATASPTPVVNRIRSSKDLEAALKRKSSQGDIGKADIGKAAAVGTKAVAFTFVNVLREGPNVRLNEVPRSATFKVPPPDDPDEDPLQDNDNDILKLVVPTVWADTGGSDYEGSFDLVIPVIDGVIMPFEQEDIDAGRVLALPYPVDTEFPVEVSIPPSILQTLSEGPHTLAYVAVNDQAGNPDESPAQTFTLDWTPPSNTRVPLALQIPEPAPPIENGQPVFDRAYLTANDPVVFPVPAYATARAGDQIRLIDGVSGNEILPWTDLWPETDAVAPTRVLRLPASVLEGLVGDGRQLRYQFRDRAGNESGLSNQLNFIVRLQEDPANLAAPVIASPINRATLFPVTNRVAVIIPDNPSLLDDDLITVTWVDGAGTPRPLVSFRYADRQTHVDWAFLSTPNSRARYTASVTYTVQRVGRPNPFGPSPAATPQVDLSIVGPVNPNEPDPINQTLTLLTVVGGSQVNVNPPQVNVITPADAVKAVKEESKIIFPMYTGAVAGHHVTIFYGTAQITALTLEDSHIGQPTLEFNLPWSTIQAQRNGVILAYYEIREVEGAANAQQSRNTEVTVSAITLLMRNFVWFDSSRSALSIPNARQNQRRGTATTRTGVINCGIQPWNGVNLILRNVRPTDPVNLSRGTVTASMTAAVTAADLAVTQGTGTPAQAALEASAAAIRAAQAAAGTPTEVSLVDDAETASAEAATQAVGTPAQLQATRAATHVVYASRAVVDAVAEEGGGGIPSVAISPGDILTVYWEYHAGESLGQAVPAPVERVLHSITVPANYDPVAGVNYQVAYEDILFDQTQNPPPPTGAASIVCRFSIRRGVEVWISSSCLVKYNTTQNGLVCRDWGSTARS